ncbi:MAG TPA: hypothetical protein VFX33_07260 [Actinomycetales bacterium]|nr:hypothetical protein [Actinomycetales bacterium]
MSTKVFDVSELFADLSPAEHAAALYLVALSPDEDVEDIDLTKAQHLQLATGGGKTEALLQALRHEHQLTEIAVANSTTVSDLLEVLAVELSRAPRTTGAGDLSQHERDILESAGVDLDGPDDFGRPEITTAAQYAALLHDALTVDQAAERLQVSPGRVRQRLSDRTLYGIQSGGRRTWRMPSWQFTQDGAVPGIDTVLRSLPPQLHPVTVTEFMHATTTDLSVVGHAVSPLQWLLSGHDPSVVADLATSIPAAP